MSNILKIEASSLIAEFRQICAQVKDIGETEIMGDSSPDLQAAFKKLDELAALEVDGEVTDLLLKSPEFNSLLPAGFEECLRVQPEPPVNNTAVFLKRK